MSNKIVSIFLPMRLANDLIRKRSKEGLSFTDVSVITGIPRKTLFRAETGDVPHLENYWILCQWLGVPLETYFSKPKTKKNA